MDSDPLENASPELLEAVEAMGGQEFLAAINDLVQDNEDHTVDWCDALWDDRTADEIVEWSIAKLAKTGPTLAHAALEIWVRTYPVVDENDDVVPGGATLVNAFVRVVLSPQIHADRYELDFRHLGEWIAHDAIRFTDGPKPDIAADE